VRTTTTLASDHAPLSDQLQRTLVLTGPPDAEALASLRASSPDAAAALAGLSAADKPAPRLPAEPEALLRALLCLVPTRRLSAAAALAHPYIERACGPAESLAVAAACAAPSEEEVTRLVLVLGDDEAPSAYRRLVNSSLVANPMVDADKSVRLSVEEGGVSGGGVEEGAIKAEFEALAMGA